MKELFTQIDPTILQSKIISYTPNIFGAIIILIFAYLLFKSASFSLRKILRKSKIEEALINIIITILKIVFFVLTALMAVGQLGINVNAALAGIGVAGIAIGFASQDALSNIVAGFVIFFDKPFRVGDYVTYEKYYGRIEEITIRSTRIRTQDNTYIVIPNQKIINEVVIDHTTNGNTRVVISVDIAYKESIDQAREVLLKAVAQIEGVLVNPVPDVVVDELGDSGVKLFVRVWIADASIERRVYFETVETVKKTLDKAGIQIPFPHLQLFVDDVKDDIFEKFSK